MILGTWFSARVKLMARLDDLEGLFQFKWFYDSISIAFELGNDIYEYLQLYLI